MSNFDEEFTRELPVLTPIQSELSITDQQEFKEFTYVAEWLVDYAQPKADLAPPALPSSGKPKGPLQNTVLSDVQLPERSSSKETCDQ